MSRCILTRQTHWRHFQFSIFTLSKVIGKKPSVIPCDLRWPCGGHWATNTPGPSRIASYDMILRKLEWSDMYSRNRKHFNISPLTFNGKGHVIDLTLGHGLKNPRYTNCRVLWPHQILKVEKWSTTNCGCGTISKYVWGWVTWTDLGQWPNLWSGWNFHTTCRIDEGTGTENLAKIVRTVLAALHFFSRCDLKIRCSVQHVMNRLLSKIIGKHLHSFICILLWPVVPYYIQNDGHVIWREKKFAPLRGANSNHHYFPVRGLCAALHVRFAVHYGTWVLVTEPCLSFLPHVINIFHKIKIIIIPGIRNKVGQIRGEKHGG